MTNAWKVFVRDPQLLRVGQITTFEKLTLTLKFNAVSTWQLTLSARDDWASTITQDGYGIIVYRGSQFIMSGSWEDFVYRWGDGQDEITVSGVDDTVEFDRRLAHPSPATPDQFGTWTTGLEDVAPVAGTSAASSIIAYLAQRNFGVNAVQNRRRTTSSSFVAFGAQMVQRARWQNLLTLCQETATAGAVNGVEPGFRVAQVGTDLQIQTYVPTDRTATVKFSPALGNVREITYQRTAPKVTTAYVGGAGEGVARTYLMKDTALSATWARREGDLASASSLSTAAELGTEADKTLADGQPKNSLSVTPLDTDKLQFGVHYFVGDRVSAVLNRFGPGNALRPGDVVTDILRECRVDITAEGSEIRATVGNDSSGSALTKIFGFVRSLRARLIDVERS